MTAEELMRRFSMEAHIENGSFIERHYASDGSTRAASGSIYYYVAPDERTEFHKIDCDEYWCYAKGSPLDVWLVREDGGVSVHKLGVEDGCEPLLYVPKGVIFASKHAERFTEGTFLSCITVPRFCYEGFTMLKKEEMLQKYPAVSGFYR